jgi:hypothetical protein
MQAEYSSEEKALQKEFRKLVNKDIFPYADEWDKSQSIPMDIFRDLGAKGLLLPHLTKELGSKGLNPIESGLFLEEVARGSASLLSDLTVHAMCADAIQQFGSRELQDLYLPKMASGETIGAFALTEPNVGSNAAQIETKATAYKNGFLINGTKHWISLAQKADQFVVFTQLNGHPTAFLLPRKNEGLEILPIHDMLGFRAAMMGTLKLTDVFVPADHQLGPEGGGFTHVAGNCLDLGRYYIACAGIGIAQASLELSLHHAQNRVQFGKPLREHQLIMAMLADMTTQLKSARALTHRAGTLRFLGDPRAIAETTTAKYAASIMASEVANKAVQIHGAQGCGPYAPVERYYRDARILQIIEGSNQMQQIMIAQNAYLENRSALKFLSQPTHL